MTDEPADSEPIPRRRRGFVVSPDSRAFQRRHFPDASAADWNDWRWQLRHRVRTAADFAQVLTLAPAEQAAFDRQPQRFSTAVTPYFLSLLDPHDPESPLRRTMVPVAAEFETHAGDMIDPLAEDRHMPVPGLVHRYPDRVLFLVTDYCPVYCRYCTRARMVGGSTEFAGTRRQWQRGIDYIAATPAVRDVLISGGDPLVLDDAQLEWLLARLRAIPHVEMIRLGTKVPLVLPQRVTPALCRMLRRWHPLYISLHAMHPAELTPESGQACERLADAGIPLGSQTVLLAGINDDVDTLRELMHGLLRVRVRPYYLLQCDPITGSGHLRTPLARGTELIRGLRGHTSGYAVPQFIVDLPDGGGKIALVPDHSEGHTGAAHVFSNYEGRSGFAYPDPEAAP
jgi:lysine 2,3-aminomutase